MCFAGNVLKSFLSMDGTTTERNQFLIAGDENSFQTRDALMRELSESTKGESKRR